jgi:hypothetical protein
MKAKEPSIIYNGKRPPGYQPAHNDVAHTPTFHHGWNGFRRFWIPPHFITRGSDHGIKWTKCPCGWHGRDRKQWEVHYAWDKHVEWWHSAIKEHGSLEAVHRFIREQLRNEAIERGHDPDWVFQ